MPSTSVAVAGRAARRHEPAGTDGDRQLLKNIRRGRTLVVVEHDMDAVFEFAERITVMHEGALLAEGTPEEIQRNGLVREAYLGGVAAA
jgi:branched-chain amino acid transport system permease protein